MVASLLEMSETRAVRLAYPAHAPTVPQAVPSLKAINKANLLIVHL
jgi:hypothetical protein